MNILICGLPGSGKTTLAQYLREHIKAQGHTCAWFNADKIREMSDDWDFSLNGRLRAAGRMDALAFLSSADYKICDFVAPTDDIRRMVHANFIIFMDTIHQGRFEDTNKLFERPATHHICISEWKSPGIMAMEVYSEIQKWRSVMAKPQHTRS